jgi:hypothetical protein
MTKEEHEHDFVLIAYSDGNIITENAEYDDIPFVIVQCSDCGTWGRTWVSPLD